MIYKLSKDKPKDKNSIIIKLSMTFHRRLKESCGIMANLLESDIIVSMFKTLFTLFYILLLDLIPEANV